MDNVTKLCKLQQGSCMPARFFEDRYQHCRDRFAERFNMELTYDEWQELNLRVFMDDDVQWLDTAEKTDTSLVIVEAFGERFLVPFTEIGFCIITILPRSDMRLLHARNNTYTARAISPDMLAYRDARRKLAENLDVLVEDGMGRLVLPKPEVAKKEPKAANPFAEALAGFKPAPVPAKRATLTLAAYNPQPLPQVAPPVPLAMDSEVLSVFAQLERQLSEHTDRLDQRAVGVEAEIASLEARLASLRGGDVGATLEREFVQMSRDMAEQAFAKYQDGLLDSASALSVARLMLSQQEVVTAAPVTEAVRQHANRSQKLPSKPSSEGHPNVHGWSRLPESKDNPWPVKHDKLIWYTLDGVQKTLQDWAAGLGLSAQALNWRLAKGMTFREAIALGGSAQGKSLPIARRA